LVEVDIVAGEDLAGSGIAWKSPCASRRSLERERGRDLFKAVKTEITA
jgi:hypothetical protein